MVSLGNFCNGPEGPGSVPAPDLPPAVSRVSVSVVIGSPLPPPLRSGTPYSTSRTTTAVSVPTSRRGAGDRCTIPRRHQPRKKESMENLQAAAAGQSAATVA